MSPDTAISDRDIIAQLESKLSSGLIPRCNEATGPPCGEEQHRCVRFAGHERFWLDHLGEDGTTW